MFVIVTVWCRSCCSCALSIFISVLFVVVVAVAIATVAVYFGVYKVPEDSELDKLSHHLGNVVDKLKNA